MHKCDKRSFRNSNSLEEESSITKANLLITLGILIQMYDFSSDDCNNFVDTYGEVLNNFNLGLENVDDLAENIYQYCGIQIT